MELTSEAVRDLDDWIGDRLPGAGRPAVAERMGQDAGIANELFWLRRGELTWVLRRPPAVVNAPGASNMFREWRILSALECTDVPHPKPLLFGEPDGPLGSSFIIMDRVNGFTPLGVLPPPYSEPSARRELSFALVDALAAIARCDWEGIGLRDLGRPEGFLERQVPRWLWQLENYATRTVPGLDWLASWLESNRPDHGLTGLMHGDYSPFNVMASWTTPTRLAAVIDWDTGTIGDPLLDIGHLLARWTDPGEAPAIGMLDIEDREGLPLRAELAAHYVESTGADERCLAYYEALALFKLAVILEGGVRRAATPSAALETAERVDRLVAAGYEFAEGARS
jgi:aminoglycoside phosphotransferase (APT) family kinase protein